MLLSCRLWYFSLHDNYPPFLYTTRFIYTAVLPFLITWNGKCRSKSNTLTISHELEKFNLAAVYTLLNTIIYLKAEKYLNNGWDRSTKRTWNLRLRIKWCTITVRTWDYSNENYKCCHSGCSYFLNA